MLYSAYNTFAAILTTSIAAKTGDLFCCSDALYQRQGPCSVLDHTHRIRRLLLLYKQLIL